MDHVSTPVGCRPQLRHTRKGPTPVRSSITDLSTVSSLLQCAALACRTQIVQEQPPDFWCVADCLELANGELWKVAETLLAVADRIEPDDATEDTDSGKDDAEDDQSAENSDTTDEEPDDPEEDPDQSRDSSDGGSGLLVVV
jgi:hypothetical protein